MGIQLATYCEARGTRRLKSGWLQSCEQKPSIARDGRRISQSLVRIALFKIMLCLRENRIPCGLWQSVLLSTATFFKRASAPSNGVGWKKCWNSTPSKQPSFSLPMAIQSSAIKFRATGRAGRVEDATIALTSVIPLFASYKGDRWILIIRLLHSECY